MRGGVGSDAGGVLHKWASSSIYIGLF